METTMTPSLEDYIEAIYALGDRDPVRLTDIATRLGLSKASASRAIATLQNEGMVTHERYGTLTLTELGLIRAQEVSRRHMLFKRFLIERLFLSEEIAEQDACRMEHAVSAQTVAALENFMLESV